MRTMASPRLKRRKLRKLWLTVHLYLALTVGFAFVVLGLTGSYNAFMTELDEVWHPELVIAHPGGAYRPFQEMLLAVRRAHPEWQGSWNLQMPRHRAGMLTASHPLPKGQAGMYYDARLVSVDPYRAEVVKSRGRNETLMGWVFDLHCALLLGDNGQKAVGILGVCLLVSVLTGVYLWWPSRGRLWQALTIKRHAGAERRVFDLHKCFGIYAAMVLTVLAFSGFYLIYSDQVRLVVNLFSPVKMDPWADLDGVKSNPLPGAAAVSIDNAVAAAQAAFPAAELQQMLTPADATGVYTLHLRQPGEANHYWPSTTVYVDQYSGQVIATRDPMRFSNGETFLNLQYPLHTGEALGLAGRIIICATGWVPLVLYVTGLLRWRQKAAGQRRHKGGKNG